MTTDAQNGISRQAATNSVHSDDERRLESVEATCNYLLSRTVHRPQIAIICGSGLAGLTHLIEEPVTFPYSEIPNFVSSTVKGHSNRLMFGKLSGKAVVCMVGRMHKYEGHSMWQVTFPIRVFHALGVRVLVVTNASGALNPDFNVGDVMLINDHINMPGLCGLNPLTGLSDERFGARFPVLADAYDVELQTLFRQTATELGLDGLRSGVYFYQSGPCYETPAECRMMHLLGGDAAGMSTVPEVIVARHGRQPMRCIGLALITNKIQQQQQRQTIASSITSSSSSSSTSSGTDEHDSVLSAAEKRTTELKQVLAKFVARIR